MKQGRTGVSLLAQKDFIEHYAARHGLGIGEWISEQVTAAKQGRPAFERMLGLLADGRFKGVIMHKIDRSARNLKDWLRLLDLLDQGVELHFCSEAIDLSSRGGRLSADIQAVVAADMIRNQREEVIKGMYGRLKQGLWPWAAPLGYLDNGGGKPKTPDPKRAPLVTRLFELYSRGSHSLRGLEYAAEKMGLTTSWGGRLNHKAIAKILSNRFYMGILHARKTDETYEGIHVPLVSAALFKRVRDRAAEKTGARTRRHDFIYRRRITCDHCGRKLVGESQKGRVYYRCQDPACPTKCFAETIVDECVLQLLTPFQIPYQVRERLLEDLRELDDDAESLRNQRESALAQREAYATARLSKLTQGYLDGALDAGTVRGEREKLELELSVIEEERRTDSREKAPISVNLQEKLELAGGFYSSWFGADCNEKRFLVDMVTSNRLARGRELVFMRSPLVLAFENVACAYGGEHSWDRTRKWEGGSVRIRKLDGRSRRVRAIKRLEAALCAVDLPSLKLSQF